MAGSERVWTMTRDQLIGALANIEVRGVKVTGPMAGKVIADDVADAILEQIPSSRPTAEQMLREFHQSKAVHGGWMPRRPTADIPEHLHELRQKLLDEETGELAEAVRDRDVVKIADALGDIVFVAVGTAVTYGIPFDVVLAEVYRSNMTKVNTPAEAKLVKGPGYEAPRIAELLGLKTTAASEEGSAP